MKPFVSCIYLTHCIEYGWKSSLWIGISQRATQRARILLTDNIQSGAAVVSTITSIISMTVDLNLRRPRNKSGRGQRCTRTYKQQLPTVMLSTVNDSQSINNKTWTPKSRSTNEKKKTNSLCPNLPVCHSSFVTGHVCPQSMGVRSDKWVTVGWKIFVLFFWAGKGERSFTRFEALSVLNFKCLFPSLGRLTLKF